MPKQEKNPDTIKIKPSDISKEIKQELISPKVVKIEPVKKEEHNDTVIIDTPDTSFIPFDITKLETEGLILMENPENSFLKVSFKTDPYDDSIIFMGTSIEPLLISDEDDDELLYITTTRDNGDEIKSNVKDIIEINEGDDDIITIDLNDSLNDSFKHLALDNNNDTNKRKNDDTEQTAEQWKKQRKEKKTTQQKAARRTSTPTDQDKHSGLAGPLATATRASTSDSQISKENVSKKNSKSTPKKANKQVQTTATEAFLYNQKNDIKTKLGFYQSNNHFLKYAIDYVTSEEYMVIFRSHGSYVRIFIKQDEPEMFLQTFYDLVNAPHANVRNHDRIMPKLQEYILQRMRQRRHMLSHPTNSYRFWYTYIFNNRLVTFNGLFILRVICTFDTSQNLIVTHISNSKVFRLYYSNMGQYRALADIYQRHANVINSNREVFHVMKLAFLRRMSANGKLN